MELELSQSSISQDCIIGQGLMTDFNNFREIMMFNYLKG